MNNEQDMDLYVADDFDEQTDNQPRWFILGKDKKKFGKYTTKQMIDYFNQGKLNENSTVACTGMKAWTKFKDTELMQYINTFDENDFVEEDFGSTYEEKTSDNSGIDVEGALKFSQQFNDNRDIEYRDKPNTILIWGILSCLCFTGIPSVFALFKGIRYLKDGGRDVKAIVGTILGGISAFIVLIAIIFYPYGKSKEELINKGKEALEQEAIESNELSDNTVLDEKVKGDIIFTEADNGMSRAEPDSENIPYTTVLPIRLASLAMLEKNYPNDASDWGKSIQTVGYIKDIGKEGFVIKDNDFEYVIILSPQSNVSLEQLKINDEVLVNGAFGGTGVLEDAYISLLYRFDSLNIEEIQNLIDAATKEFTTFDAIKILYEPLVNNSKVDTEDKFSITSEAKYTVLYEDFNTHDDKYGDGSISFYVQAIRNDSSLPIYVKDAKYEMNDKNGHLIKAEESLTTTPNIIEPGEVGYIYENYMSCDKPSSQVGQPTIMYEVKPIDKHSMRDKFVLSDTSITTNFGHQLTGRVTNNTGEKQGWVEITVLFFDNNDKMVGWDHSNVMDLDAGDTKSFDTGGSSDYEKYKYEVYVEPAFETPLW